SLDQLHHQVVGTNIVNVADIRMIQRRDGMDFALEPIAEALSGSLDSHFAPHPWIAGAVHLAHAARAQRRQDLIRAELRTRCHFLNPACQSTNTVTGFDLTVSSRARR